MNRPDVMRPVAVIGAPSSAGAFAPGQEDAPAALREAGLLGALAAGGREVHDRGDTPRFRWRVDRAEPLAMNIAAVVDGVRAVATRVRAAVCAGELALVLGGDCTVGVGTVAGVVAAGAEPRLVYLDLHADLNTPESVPDGALDWTGVAHMIDVRGADPRLAAAGPRRPLLSADDLVLLGRDPGQGTPAENQLVADRALATVGVEELAADPQAAARRALEQATADDRPLVVHFDVDVIDFSDVPLSENTGRGIGVPFEAALAALDVLITDGVPLAVTVTELNPYHGATDATDVARFAQALADALGHRQPPPRRRGQDRAAALD